MSQLPDSSSGRYSDSVAESYASTPIENQSSSFGPNVDVKAVAASLTERARALASHPLALDTLMTKPPTEGGVQ